MSDQDEFLQDSQSHNDKPGEIASEMNPDLSLGAGQDALNHVIDGDEGDDNAHADGPDGQLERQLSSSPRVIEDQRFDRISEQNNEDKDEIEASNPPGHDGEQYADPKDIGATSYLKTLDWMDFQQRFDQRMEEKRQEEQEILQEFHRLNEFYEIWSQAGAYQERERASKRLRTRIAYVQNSELQLEEKRNHHANVVQAFQSALQLLGGL